jgi:hypothetical protein
MLAGIELRSWSNSRYQAIFAPFKMKMLPRSRQIGGIQMRVSRNEVCDARPIFPVITVGLMIFDSLQKYAYPVQRKPSSSRQHEDSNRTGHEETKDLYKITFQ